jgi:hypothetical protein
MKNVIKTTIIFATLIAVACNSDTQSDKSVKELRAYVDSVENDNTRYYGDDNYWNNVEVEYTKRQEQVEAKAEKLSTESKNEYESLKNDYTLLKAKYDSEHNKVKEARSYKMMFRGSLFGEGTIGDDMSFDFMTAQNALVVYEKFVTTVEKNKESYSREDWDEVKVLYEAMDTRKNEIEKDLVRMDNTKIAGLKIKFATIKAINRPLSKAAENADAKK